MRPETRVNAPHWLPTSAETRGGEQLGVEGGTRLADDEGAEHAGEQPHRVREALKPGQERFERRVHRVGSDVPDQEDEPAGDADHAGDDDVDDAPAEGSELQSLSCLSVDEMARDLEKCPPCAGMIQIRFDGRSLEKLPLSPAHRTPVFGTKSSEQACCEHGRGEHGLGERGHYARGMDFRIFTEPQQGASYDDLLTIAQAAEALGFDGFFRSDHFLTMGSNGMPGPTDAWTTLAGLARETSSIRLGTLVSSVTFRHPGILAVQVAQVDQMSGGRIELGLGTGWFQAEHEALGIPFPDQTIRDARRTARDCHRQLVNAAH